MCYSHISLFAGAGGFDIGAAENGFETQYACDWEENSEQFFKNNFPDVPFDCTDVRNVTLERINDVRANKGLEPIKRGETDVLSGGSPCVKVSASNTTDARDFAPENTLMIENLPRIVHDIQPRIAVFENSDRLCAKSRSALLMEIKASYNTLLPNYRYCVKVLNAKRYGAFQNRNRTIIVLVRKDVLNNRTLDFYPNRMNINLSKQGVTAILPHVVAFSGGQFGKKFKTATGKIFCTITASVSQLVREADMVSRKITVDECKKLTAMGEYDFSDICNTGIYTLLGNMIMRQLTRLLFQNFCKIL